MKFGKPTPEGFAPHSGKTILQRNLERGGLLRPRIQLPDLPAPLPEGPTEEDEGVLLGEDDSDYGENEEDGSGPSIAQVKIP